MLARSNVTALRIGKESNSKLNRLASTLLVSAIKVLPMAKYTLTASVNQDVVFRYVASGSPQYWVGGVWAVGNHECFAARPYTLRLLTCWYLISTSDHGLE